MAKARMIHRELFTSADLEDLPAAARLIFIGMIVHADDEGLVRDQPVLFARLYCNGIVLRPCRVRTWLVSLASRGCIASVQREGVSYWQITNFARFQRLNKNKNKNRIHPSGENRKESPPPQPQKASPRQTPNTPPEPAPAPSAPPPPPPPPRRPTACLDPSPVTGAQDDAAEVFHWLTQERVLVGQTKARQILALGTTMADVADWTEYERVHGTAAMLLGIQAKRNPRDLPPKLVPNRAAQREAEIEAEIAQLEREESEQT